MRFRLWLLRETLPSVQAKTAPGTVVVYAAYRGLPEAAVTLKSE
jgi:hypothetical protein